jgi:hypothetical protein
VSRPPDWLVKRVLLGPAAVRRAAASRLPGKQERWMLKQPTSVRQSYVRDVLERGGGDQIEQAWMLRQPDHVRESYAAEVLGVT